MNDYSEVKWLITHTSYLCLEHPPEDVPFRAGFEERGGDQEHL